MEKSLCITSVALFASALFSAGAKAQTIQAASCNASDVQAALNSVTASTTTVKIPSGTCHWSGQVTLTVPSGSTSLSILGAGSLSTVGGGDATVIIDDYGSTQPLLAIATGPASSFLRLAGITIQGGSGGIKQNGAIEMTGESQSVRVDHNHLNLSTYSSGGEIGVLFVDPTGVFDHNLCDDGGGVNECVNVWALGYGGQSFGDGAWADSSNLGSSNFMFVENNTINGGLYMDDCDDGGREVVRYNTINQAQTQTHPTGSAGRRRGCRAKEVYQNTFNGSPSCNGSSGFNNCTFGAYFLSSGTGVIWGNSLPVVNAAAGSGYQWLISLHSMRRDNSTYQQTATPNGWGYCGTSFNGTGSAWDGNANATTGYPCLDQPGRGKGQLLANDFPNAVKTATNSIAWPNDALEPIYEWMDSMTPVPNNPGGLMNNYSSDVLVQNQDFYLYNSNFNGKSGVGSGLLSARPATCTPMVAYWATDTNTLYQCSSPNTWTTYYKPYTYPHPLTQQQTTSPPSSAPAAPTDLTVSSVQ